MGTYHSSNPLMSEANQSASIPRFAWFHPGTFLSSAKTGYNPLQPAHIDADVGINPIPLRSIPPPSNEAPNNDTGIPIGHAKAKKPKTPKRSADNAGSEPSKPKRSKKGPTTPSKKAKGSTMSGAKCERKDLNFAAYKGNLDITGVPAPFCSCTGVPRQCYRWGAGGWQSSCCTINVSEYPLPMSATRPGSRMAGRKMSHGAFEKLLQRLAGDGFDLSQPVDLREHWARHGTNKFVTIK